MEEPEGRCCLYWLPFRAMYAALRRHPSIWIVPLLAVLVLATGGIVGVMTAAATETRQARLNAEGSAMNAAVALENQLLSMFGPLLSLATIIRFDPYYPHVNASFDRIAQQLLDQLPTQGAVTTLIAAPQGVLRNFYPMKGYCQDRCDNININLFETADRRPVALKTVETGKLTMQGPMILAQGYFGVVGRQPIFVSPSTPNETFGAPDGLANNCSVCWRNETQEQFWGFVNAVINFDPLFNGSDSRVKDLATQGYRYRMYTRDKKTGALVKITQSQELPHDPIVTDVHVPGSNWTLEVAPARGWVPGWRPWVLAVVVIVSCLIGLLLAAILVSARLQTWLKSANDALAQEKERMDVLLARQYNLISCVLHQDESSKPKRSLEHRTLAKIEDMRREIGVSSGSAGVDELQLIELIDEGTYGKVFRGMWRGSCVAVKSMILPAKMSGAEKRERMAIMEAAISSAMNHPNIVQTYTYIIKPSSSSIGHACSASEGSLSSLVTAAELAPSMEGLDAPEANHPTVHNFEVSLVLEYCDWGSLRTALDAGAFFAEDNSLNYAAILDTAADIARAMMHLHKNQVLHSDLKVRNVLLKSDASARGCIVKVADFGLAVRMECCDTHVSAFQGTMSHMAPEALLHGRISKAGDVYAFGISLWELFTGGQAYQGIPRALVGHKVAVLGLRPTLPPFTPPDFKALIEECWAQDPEQRPSFDAILAKLLAIRHALGPAATPPLARYTLQHKGRVRERSKSEEAQRQAANTEENLAGAQAGGLVRMSSYYVSSSCSSDDEQGLAGSAAAAAGGSGSGSGAPAGILVPSRSVTMSLYPTKLDPIKDEEDEGVPCSPAAAAAAAAARQPHKASGGGSSSSSSSKTKPAGSPERDPDIEEGGAGS
ncbi:hypothetical protein OEZ86_005253 [Tetradesmus obliquus]|nr:hypothetical protein OEZ86_005253 [Tetradesmus obliquus]